MNDTDKKILEYCGFKPIHDNTGEIRQWVKPDNNRIVDMPELTCEWLFSNFVPAWNKNNPEKAIDSIAFGHFLDELDRPKYCEVMAWNSTLATEQGKTEALAFAEAALKLIKTA